MRRVVVLSAFVLVSMIAALAPPGTTTQAQGDCFGTGFCIQNPAFREYYMSRGQERTLGFPISNEFTLEGFQVQFFQRVVLQMNQGSVARLNVLDPNIMPMTRANQSVFPGPDPALAAQAPQVTSPTYAKDVVNFVQKVSPNTFNGQPVNFFNTFMNTVPPQPGASQDIMTLLNLEIWGVPTSNPAADPGNGGFIYQRYQRGIMHFRAECDCTEGILIGEYFKSVITGVNLPPDLQADMQSSRYYRQYAPDKPNAVARPDQLPNTNMTGAWGAIQAPPPPPPVTTPVATGTVTPTVTTGPSVTIQVDDNKIDPGQQISITVIASDPIGLDWIEWEGIPGGNDNGNDNSSQVNDPALARQQFTCDSQAACANVWTVTPTVSGDYVLRARARNKADVRSAWTTTDLQVRSSSATATATTAAATQVPTPVLPTPVGPTPVVPTVAVPTPIVPTPVGSPAP